MDHTSESLITAEPEPYVVGHFYEKLTRAVPQLSRRLQARYEGLHPRHRQLVRDVIADAEATAWELSNFPHLLLPDLVEARMAELALGPAFTRRHAPVAYAA